MLGYELNILKTDQTVKDEIRRQISFYRQVEDLIKRGDLYRLLSPFESEGETAAYYYTASPEMGEAAGERILLSYLQNKGLSGIRPLCLKIRVADADAVYQDLLSGECYSGRSLQEGISVTHSASDEYGKIWLFQKKKLGSISRKWA